MQCTSIIRFRYIRARNYRALSLIRINTKVSGISVIFLYSIALILGCFGNFVANHFHDMKLINSWVIKVWSFVRLKFLKFLNFELKLFWIKKLWKNRKWRWQRIKWRRKVSLLSCNAWKVSFFGFVLVRIFPHSDWIRRDTPYSVRIRENANQNNSEYGHCLCNDVHKCLWGGVNFHFSTNFTTHFTLEPDLTKTLTPF